jgi:DHA1 family tetracycline resistance protein-like MFS transporter
MRSPLLPIFLTVFVDVLGLTLILPLLPYYAKDYGASDFQVGLLTSVYAIAMFISGPILGRISDRIGRKPVLLASQLGSLAGWLVLAFSPNLETLFIGRIISGLTAGNLSTAQAYISDVTEANEERTQAFGFFGIAFGLGFVLGPGITGLLTKYFADHADKLAKYRAPTLTAAGLSLLAILLTAFLLRPSKPVARQSAGAGRSSAFVQFFARSRTRTLLAQFFLFSVSFAGLTGSLGPYLQHSFQFSVEDTSMIFGLSGFIGAVVQGGLRKLAKRFGEERLAMVGLGSMATAYFFLGAAHHTAMLLVLVVLGSFGAAVVRPSLTTLITKAVEDEEQGAVLGVSQSLGSAAQAIGPLAATWLIEREQLVLYGVFCGGFSLLGCLVAAWLERNDAMAKQATARG